MGNEKADFELGRMHGERGAFSTNDSDAYRQGMQVGAIERQTRLLKEQARQDESRAAEARRKQKAAEAREREVRFREKFEREQAEAAQRQYIDERAHGLDLIRAAEEFAPQLQAKTRRVERDALYFIAEKMRVYRAKDPGLAALVREAHSALARSVIDLAPTVPPEVVALVQAVLALRQEVAAFGFLLPFDDSTYSPAELRYAGEPGFSSREAIPAWLERGPATNLDLQRTGLPIDAERVRRALATFATCREPLLARCATVAQHARQVDALGLWAVARKFLAWKQFADGETCTLGVSDCLGVVYSHQRLVRELVDADDCDRWLERWLLEPNHRLAAQVDAAETAIAELQRWQESEAPDWFDPDNIEVPLGLLAQCDAISALAASLDVLKKRQSLLRHARIARRLASAGEPCNLVQQCREAVPRGRPDPELFADGLIAAPPSPQLSLARVRQRSAQLVCALLGPFYYISPGEVLLGAAGGVLLGCVLFGIGFEFTGVLLAGVSMLTGWYGFGSLTTHYLPEQASHAYVRSARWAYRRAPALSIAQQLALWRSINGLAPLATTAGEPGDRGSESR
jgi:hypothetical protein